MSQDRTIIVTGKDGLRGRVIQTAQTSSTTANAAQTVIQLEDGQQVYVPTDMLTRRDDNTFYLPMSLNELSQGRLNTMQANQTDTMVLPVIAEELEVSKRRVESGRVRISKKVQEHEETINEPLLHDEVQVERVPINQVATANPTVRYEGDTMIIPILEEVLVVEKRLMIKEEVRVTRHQTTTEGQPQTVILRTEEVTVERLDGNGNSTTTQTQAIQ